MRVLRDLFVLLILAFLGLLIGALPMVAIMALNGGQLTSSSVIVGQWLTGPFVFFLPAILWFLIFHHGENVWKAFYFRMPSWRAVAISIVFTFVSLPIASASASWLSVFELPQSMQDYFDAQAVQQIKMIVLMMGDFGPLSAVNAVLLVGVATGIAEETMFRGAVRRIFADSFGIHGTALIVGFIFSLIHFEFYGFVWRWALGSVYVYLVYCTGSIWPSIVAHALNNSLSVLTMIFSDEFDSALPTTDAEWLALAQSQDMPMPISLSIASFVATVALAAYFWQNRAVFANKALLDEKKQQEIAVD